MSLAARFIPRYEVSKLICAAVLDTSLCACDVYFSEVVQCDYEGQAGILVCREYRASVASLLKIKYCLDNLLPQLFSKEVISRLADFLT